MDNIVWGTFSRGDDNIVWGTLLGGDNIVWGTLFGDDNIVWGTLFGGNAQFADNIVWGTAMSWTDNIVWGTGLVGMFDGDNIVWGTMRDGADNIVWGTLSDDNIVWGTSVNKVLGLGSNRGWAVIGTMTQTTVATVPVPGGAGEDHGLAEGAAGAAGGRGDAARTAAGGCALAAPDAHDRGSVAVHLAAADLGGRVRTLHRVDPPRAGGRPLHLLRRRAARLRARDRHHPDPDARRGLRHR